MFLSLDSGQMVSYSIFINHIESDTVRHGGGS